MDVEPKRSSARSIGRPTMEGKTERCELGRDSTRLLRLTMFWEVGTGPPAFDKLRGISLSDSRTWGGDVMKGKATYSGTVVHNDWWRGVHSAE